MKKKVKHISLTLLVVSMLLSGCGSKENDGSSRNNSLQLTTKSDLHEERTTDFETIDNNTDVSSDDHTDNTTDIDLDTSEGLIEKVSGYEEGNTTAVYYKEQMIPLAGTSIAEDVFLGDYNHQEVNDTHEIAEGSAILDKINYTKEINGKTGFSNIPLSIRFGRGIGSFGTSDNLSEGKTTQRLNELHKKIIDRMGDEEGEKYYRNYMTLCNTYTADVYFLQEGKNKLTRQLCRYSVSGNTIHFQGIDIKEDASYTDNSFSIDMTYMFSGLDLLVECDGELIELIPVNKKTVEDGSDTVVCEVTDLTGCIDDIIEISSYGRSESSDNYVFFIDGCAADIETLMFDRDGTFTLKCHKTAFNPDETVNHEHNIDISGEYIGRGASHGATIILDGKAYNFTKPFGEYDDLLWGSFTGSNSEKEKVGNNRTTAAERIKEVFGEDANVIVDEVTGEVTMNSALLFGFDSSELEDVGKNVLQSFLDKYADVIIALKDEGIITGVEIDGYTDSVGTYSYNLQLSEDRATNVLSYCVEDHPELSGILSAKGLGSDNLIINPDKTINDEASRRVCFKLLISTGK